MNDFTGLSADLWSNSLEWPTNAAEDHPMAYLRFHRSRQILPGIRLNLSKRGGSVSLGVRGARLNIGPKGLRATAGIPGSGLSLIHQTSWQALQGRQSRQRGPVQMAVLRCLTLALQVTIGLTLAFLAICLGLAVLAAITGGF